MNIDPGPGYDLIGDIHGCANALEHLLERMGYSRQRGVWRHPRRKALFIGDIVDRGPHIREALHLVHDMVEAGEAWCIMGNHEFNALAWHTPALPGSGKQYVREHTPRHHRLIAETLQQFDAYPQEWRDFVGWFEQLPLFIDAGRFRLVHACWDAGLIEQIRHRYPQALIDSAFIQASDTPGTLAARASERLLRGIDLPLPGGLQITGRDGFTRRYFRTKFWEEAPNTYGDIVFQPDALPDEIIHLPLDDEHRAHLLHYDARQPMLFVGHYWCEGEPWPLRPNLACLDYSAVKYGKLVAYRLDQETRILPEKFVWIDVQRPRSA